MAAEAQVLQLVNELLRIEPIEEAFNNVIRHSPEERTANLETFHQRLANGFTALTTADQKESALRQILIKAESKSNLSQMRTILNALSYLTERNLVPARMLCDQILACERLVYQKQNFWIECFACIRRTIVPCGSSLGVDYKGVREIMKGCREKSLTFPRLLNSSTLPQMLVLEQVLEFIFDRENCLLPAYFIANEIQKTDDPFVHWKLSGMVARFIEGFRQTAQMLTIIGHGDLVPIVNHFGSDHLVNPWRLDAYSLKFALKGNLPYEPDVTRPQVKLLRFLLEQMYSKDIICSILNLQKQHKHRYSALERELVWLIMTAMERTELLEPNMTALTHDDTSVAPNATHWLWLHLSSQIIYFVLCQYANFSGLVTSLHEALSERPDLRKGRDHLMWMLLQFISGSIQRHPLATFLPVLQLYDLLYPEREPLPVPDCSRPSCTRIMAPTCIFIHLLRKAQTDQIPINRTIPIALQRHHAFLQDLVQPNSSSSSNLATPLALVNDYRIVLICNAFSTHQDYFFRAMQALVETVMGTKSSSSASNPQDSAGTSSSTTSTAAATVVVPFPVVVLDSFSVHSKMSLIHSIGTHIGKLAQAKAAVTPTLIETYARLLVYTEIESIGIKNFLGQLLPTVFKSNAWSILYTFMEMFSYRVHHIQSPFRIQLLSHLPALASVPHAHQVQLHLCVESAALRLITGLGSAELQQQISQYLSEPKAGTAVVSTESEELNRALILTVARSMHITGTGHEPVASSWCKDLLVAIMQYTPHFWEPHTLQCFPPVLNEFFAQNPVARENKQALKKNVEEEYRNWVSMSNETDIIAHFSVSVNPPLFLCLIFKMICETNSISPVAYKILERIGARGISVHLRKLIDYLMNEVGNCGASALVSKYVEAINDMIWKYNVVTFDRLVFCLALRAQDEIAGKVCFFIQLVLLKSSEFRNRVQDFVKDNNPEHWKQSNWHEKNFLFHQKYPEKFSPDESHPMLPVYFGNVCLRSLPVLDIVIHRFLEGDVTVMSTIISILEHLGCLYKFHDRPITYLYNTLHYYERKVRDMSQLKKKMVGAVLGSLRDVKPANWALSEQYQEYLRRSDADDAAAPWQPDLAYYMALVQRLVHTMDGEHLFYVTDWRFNEFFNAATHALYVTCMELLALPVHMTVVANHLFDVIVKGYPRIPASKLMSWINAIGLLFANLPQCAWSVMYDRLQEVLMSAQMLDWQGRHSPFEMLNLRQVTEAATVDRTYVATLAVSQSILHHFSVGQISTLTDCVKEKLKPIVRTEHQLVFLCHLVGPFVQRLNTEIPRQVPEITALLYDLVETIDATAQHASGGSKPLQFMEPVLDLLYHMKYMFVGDNMKMELDAIIRRLSLPLQKRLRFIANTQPQIGVAPPGVAASTAAAAAAAASTAAAIPNVAASGSSTAGDGMEH